MMSGEQVVNINWLYCLKKYITRLICFIDCAAILYFVLTIKIPYYIYINVLFRVFEYFVYLACSVFTKDRYIIEYFTFDCLVDSKNNKIYLKLGKFYLVYVLIAAIFYTVCNIIFFYHKDNVNYELTRYLLSTVLRYCYDIERFSVILILSLFYCRIKIFCSQVRLEISQRSKMMDRMKTMKLYIHIVNTLKKTDFPLKFLIFINLIIRFMDVLVLQYKLFVTTTTLSRSAIVALVAKDYLELFLPSIILEIAADELGKLKTFVADGMISATDDKQCQEYLKLLKFLREQDFKYYIWRAIPVDVRLPLGFTSLALTYLVCILQFAHVYGRN